MSQQLQQRVNRSKNENTNDSRVDDSAPASQKNGAISPKAIFKIGALAIVALLGTVAWNGSNQSQRSLHRRAATGLQDSTEVSCTSARYVAVSGSGATDSWCQASCGAAGATYCPSSLCQCYVSSTPTVGKWQILFEPGYFNVKVEAGQILQLTDYSRSGNLWSVAVDDVTVGPSSAIQYDPNIYTTDPDVAYASSAYTHQVLKLAIGLHKVTLTETGSVYPGGGSFAYRVVDTTVCTPSDLSSPFRVVGNLGPYTSAAQTCQDAGLNLADLSSTNSSLAGKAVHECQPVINQAWIGKFNTVDYYQNGQTCMEIVSNSDGQSSSVNAAGSCTKSLPVLCSV